MQEAENVLNILANISLKDRINRGKYDWVTSHITEERFPIDVLADYSAEYKLFHFNRPIFSEDVIKEMEKEDFQPGTLAELLVLGETRPELQRQFPIVALGSVCLTSTGFHDVPILESFGQWRKLRLGCFEIKWHPMYRFLAVRT
jgi:hypothetical protein